jgi:hypothetical protein
MSIRRSETTAEDDNNLQRRNDSIKIASATPDDGHLDAANASLVSVSQQQLHDQLRHGSHQHHMLETVIIDPSGGPRSPAESASCSAEIEPSSPLCCDVTGSQYEIHKVDTSQGDVIENSHAVGIDQKIRQEELCHSSFAKLPLVEHGAAVAGTAAVPEVVDEAAIEMLTPANMHTATAMEENVTSLSVGWDVDNSLSTCASLLDTTGEIKEGETIVI